MTYPTPTDEIAGMLLISIAFGVLLLLLVFLGISVVGGIIAWVRYLRATK